MRSYTWSFPDEEVEEGHKYYIPVHPMVLRALVRCYRRLQTINKYLLETHEGEGELWEEEKENHWLRRQKQCPPFVVSPKKCPFGHSSTLPVCCCMCKLRYLSSLVPSQCRRGATPNVWPSWRPYSTPPFSYLQFLSAATQGSLPTLQCPHWSTVSSPAKRRNQQ